MAEQTRGLNPSQFVAPLPSPVPPCQSWSVGIADAGLRLEELFELVRNALEFVRVSGGILLTGQVGPFLRILPVHLKPLLGFGLGVGDDRLGRALRLANATVDAFVGLDHKHVIPLVEAVDGAHLDAVGIFALDAVFGDDVGHARFPFSSYNRLGPSRLSRPTWLSRQFVVQTVTRLAVIRLSGRLYGRVADAQSVEHTHPGRSTVAVGDVEQTTHPAQVARFQ